MIIPCPDFEYEFVFTLIIQKLNPLSAGNKNDSVRLETRIHSSARDVWKAWTDPELILKWIGSDPDGEGLKAQMDTRPGGKYEISFRNSDGSKHTCFGIYIEVLEFRNLAFSWEWENEPGVVSIVEISLTPDGDDTMMQFVHAHVGNLSMHDYHAGWESTFVKLNQLLINKKSGYKI
jgi:uncharacterized protein YndB with AHSA1/START domain